MGSKQDINVLLRKNAGKWSRKVLELCWKNKSFDILCQKTQCQEWRIGCDSFISLKNVPNKNIIFIRACPKNKKGYREFHCYEVEFSSTEELEDFSEFLKENNFVSKTKSKKKVIVFVNPVSGRGRARQIWSEVNMMLSESETVFETVVTERSGQAMDTVETLDLDKYDGVVTVSGDGGLFEVINGLYKRRHKDGPEVMERLHIGIVPGGSGHGVHNSILHHHGEKFDSEKLFSALSLARQQAYHHDIVECQTREREFASVFGVAWGVIPEVDLESEFLRWMGPNRGWFVAIWKWMFPHFNPGTVHYLEHNEDHDEDDIKLPGINDPVPQTWTTVQGPFFNVYACKQPWLDYSLLFCPEAKPDDGKLWLVIQDSNFGHRDGAHWMFNGDRAAHLDCASTKMVAVSAFRFEPQMPDKAVMTVDAERLELGGGPVQGVVRRRRVNIMTK